MEKVQSMYEIARREGIQLHLKSETVNAIILFDWRMNLPPH
jgi:hypothetical protein